MHYCVHFIFDNFVSRIVILFTLKQKKLKWYDKQINTTFSNIIQHEISVRFINFMKDLVLIEQINRYWKNAANAQSQKTKNSPCEGEKPNFNTIQIQMAFHLIWKYLWIWKQRWSISSLSHSFLLWTFYEFKWVIKLTNSCDKTKCSSYNWNTIFDSNATPKAQSDE